jgi:hypothetical protein
MQYIYECISEAVNYKPTFNGLGYGWTILGLNPAEASGLYFLQRVPTGSGSHPAF